MAARHVVYAWSIAMCTRSVIAPRPFPTFSVPFIGLVVCLVANQAAFAAVGRTPGTADVAADGTATYSIPL